MDGKVRSYGWEKSSQTCFNKGFRCSINIFKVIKVTITYRIESKKKTFNQKVVNFDVVF